MPGIHRYGSPQWSNPSAEVLLGSPTPGVASWRNGGPLQPWECRKLSSRIQWGDNSGNEIPADTLPHIVEFDEIQWDDAGLAFLPNKFKVSRPGKYFTVFQGQLEQPNTAYAVMRFGVVKNGTETIATWFEDQSSSDLQFSYTAILDLEAGDEIELQSQEVEFASGPWNLITIGPRFGWSLWPLYFTDE